MSGVFITGTDTGVGKTRVAVAMLEALRAEGVRAVGMKPVAAGIEAGEACNRDVSALAAASSVPAPLAHVNPYAFAPAIAPHLAAQRDGVVIEIERIAAAYAQLLACADAVVVEGAGGALVPLTERADMLDIPARLALPVVLVVGLRLGCLNHALLTAQAISARGLRLAGWVGNRIDPAMDAADANAETLRRRMPAPLLADLPWDAPPQLRECVRALFGLPARGAAGQLPRGPA